MKLKLRLHFAGWVLIIAFVTSCSSNQPDKNSSISVPESSTNIKANLPPKQDFLKQNLPHLYNLIAQKPALTDSLNDYAYRVLNADALITTEAAVKQIFTQRETLIIPQLYKQILEPLSNDNPDVFRSDESEYLFNELQEIGMKGIFAEGMFIELGPSAMLTHQLETLAQEPYTLYIQFKQAQTEAMGGEYPFLNLEGEIISLNLGEQLHFKYPDSQYTKDIEAQFRFCLNTLTDVHALSGKYDTGFLTHGLSFEHYPYETNLEEIKSFATQYPQSKYANIISQITANPSEMELAVDAPKPVYLVLLTHFARGEVREKTNTHYPCKEADQLRYQYLDKGIDIAHSMQLFEQQKPVCALVYRFYPTAAKAKQALEQLQAKLPDAKTATVVRVVYDEKEAHWAMK